MTVNDNLFMGIFSANLPSQIAHGATQLWYAISPPQPKHFESNSSDRIWYQQIKNYVEDIKTNECFLSTPTLFLEDKVISSPAFEYGNGISCKLQHNKNQFINCFITH